jgi:hypothetical protein
MPLRIQPGRVVLHFVLQDVAPLGVVIGSPGNAGCLVVPMVDAAAGMVYKQSFDARSQLLNAGPTAPAGCCLPHMHTAEFEVAALALTTA